MLHRQATRAGQPSQVCKAKAVLLCTTSLQRRRSVFHSASSNAFISLSPSLFSLDAPASGICKGFNCWPPDPAHFDFHVRCASNTRRKKGLACPARQALSSRANECVFRRPFHSATPPARAFAGMFVIQNPSARFFLSPQRLLLPPWESNHHLINPAASSSSRCTDQGEAAHTSPPVLAVCSICKRWVSQPGKVGFECPTRKNQRDEWGQLSPRDREERLPRKKEEKKNRQHGKSCSWRNQQWSGPPSLRNGMSDLLGNIHCGGFAGQKQ